MASKGYATNNFPRKPAFEQGFMKLEGCRVNHFGKWFTEFREFIPALAGKTHFEKPVLTVVAEKWEFGTGIEKRYEFSGLRIV